MLKIGKYFFAMDQYSDFDHKNEKTENIFILYNKSLDNTDGLHILGILKNIINTTIRIQTWVSKKERKSDITLYECIRYIQ